MLDLIILAICAAFFITAVCVLIGIVNASDKVTKDFFDKFK